MERPHAQRLAELEAEYERLSTGVERSGGVDYGGELFTLRKKIDIARQEAAKWAKIYQAVESADPRITGRLIMELLIDQSEDAAEIAADFIENEVGRLDWVNNWQTIKAKEDPAAKVQAYLNNYSLVANPQEIVNIIDRMATENPGLWK